MMKLSELPPDAADWSGVVVQFPRLKVDSAQSCPLKEDDVFDYVNLESADYESAERPRFRFLRTAKVADRRFWLWEYVESGGVRNYVYVKSRWLTTLLCLHEANGLSPEQFLLAAYYEKITWG